MNIVLDSIQKHAISVPYGITSFVGGGGKTSMIYWIADAIPSDKHVIITTSTHMFIPEHIPFVTSLDKESIESAFRSSNVICFGNAVGDGKYHADMDQVEKTASFCDFVLCEADGSKQFPVKLPAAHEPVIPPSTRMVFGCAGLDCIGENIGNVLFRSELLPDLFIQSQEDSMNEEVLAQILINPNGTMKDVPESSGYCIILNKAECEMRLKSGRIVCEILNASGFSDILIVSAEQRKVYYACSD